MSCLGCQYKEKRSPNCQIILAEALAAPAADRVPRGELCGGELPQLAPLPQADLPHFLLFPRGYGFYRPVGFQEGLPGGWSFISTSTLRINSYFTWLS